MRMSEPAKDAAFAFESFFSRVPGKRDAHELYRGLSLEPAVTALGQPYASHSAPPDLRDQLVGADVLADKPRGNR